MAELLKNNDHIYQELRKATEKYLNQRVENSKLKDEIQILNSQLEQQAKRMAGIPASPHGVEPG